MKKNISKSKKSNILSLCQINIDDHYLQKISKLTNLIDLKLYDCVSLHTKLDFLQKMTSLQNLSLPFSKIHDDDICCLKPLTNLIKLELTQNPLNGVGFANMYFPNLVTLIMIRVNLNIDGIKRICESSPNLQEFDHYADYYEGKFDNACLLEICTKLKYLRELILCDVNCFDYELLNLSTSLESLSIHHTPNPSNYIGFPKIIPTIDPKYNNLNTFPVLTKIKSLSLSIRFSELIMPKINLYSSLEQLSISCLTNDLNYFDLVKLTNLTDLKIHAYLCNNNLIFLEQMPQLKKLDLRYNHDIDIESVRYFTNFVNLQYLNLVGTTIKKCNMNEIKKNVNDTCQICL